MLEITEKRLASLLWVLKNKNKTWSVFELTKGVAKMQGIEDHRVYKKNKTVPTVDIALTYTPTLSFVKELEKNGFLHKDRKTQEYGVSRAPDLVRLISLARPFNSLNSLNYHSSLDFQKKLSLLGKIAGKQLSYAFTVFAGSELYRPYVKTDAVHAYVLESEIKEWEKALLHEGFLKAEKREANVFLIPTKQESIFSKAEKVKGYHVAPVPILLSDLLSFGGLGEEQGSFLLEEWLNNRI